MSGKKYLLLALFGLIAFLPFISYLATKGTAETHNNMTKCIFCDIVAGKIPNSRIERETDEFVIVKDIKPASKYHYLAISKRHIESVKKLTQADDDLVVHMQTGLEEFFKAEGIDTHDALFGFHLPPFISVKHLHMHGIAPRSTMTRWNSFMFWPGGPWFRTVEQAREMLQKEL